MRWCCRLSPSFVLQETLAGAGRWGEPPEESGLGCAHLTHGLWPPAWQEVQVQSQDTHQQAGTWAVCKPGPRHKPEVTPKPGPGTCQAPGIDVTHLETWAPQKNIYTCGQFPGAIPWLSQQCHWPQPGPSQELALRPPSRILPWVVLPFAPKTAPGAAV